MKTLNLFTLIAIATFFFACGPYDYADYGYEEAYYGNEYYEEYDEAQLAQLEANGGYAATPTQTGYSAANDNPNFQRTNYQNVNNNNRNNQQGNIKYFPVYDPKTRMVSRYVPLPSHWNVGDFWTTPTGSKVGYVQGGMVNFSSIDQVINQVIIPKYQNKIRVVRIDDLPQIASADKNEAEGYYSYMPTQNHPQAKGIEYTENGTGAKGYLIVHFMVKTNQMGRTAFHYAHNLYSTGNTFEQDKKAIVYALANSKMNPQYLQAYNQREAGQLAANDAAFQRKMAARWQDFNNTVAANRTNSDISDIYQETWRNTSGMNDAGHEKTINGIHERTAITNPYTGGTTYVPNANKYHYMNKNGQYMGTNNALYNPNLDPRVNNNEWKRMGGN